MVAVPAHPPNHEGAQHHLLLHLFAPVLLPPRSPSKDSTCPNPAHHHALNAPPSPPPQTHTRTPRRFCVAADQDLRHAEEVVGCCSVRHEPADNGTWLAISIIAVLLGGVLLAAVLSIRAAHPPNPRLAKARSVRDRERDRAYYASAAPGLPRWSGAGGLPR